MTEDTAYDTALALIGMSGRFPGARNVEEFWHNIAGGVSSIHFFSDEELLAAGVDPELLKQPDYVKAGTLIEDVDRFDAAFFGYTPREAELMDPQQRLFLECAWEALEDAAYDVERNTLVTGIFAGSAFCSYLFNNISQNSELLKLVDTLQIAVGNERDALVSNVSYRMNLRGPVVATQTFCSTSLVATHMACQSLLNYECDMSLAGGVAIQFPHVSGYVYKEGGIVSPDGVCRTFDAQGQGSVMGNGVGVVVLKRLRDALENHDHIYAVIRGSAVNNDGSLRVSGTAPGQEGQTAVIAEALGNAGVDAESIGYIEAHGTATELGDAVELAAMMNAFEPLTQARRFCAIGSVKPNIGHLDRAAGVAGLLKTVMALQRQQLPPSLNFERTSSDIHLEESPFYVNTTFQTWHSNGAPRRAGVSSFGLGGTNAHMVLEEAPAVEPTSSSRPWQLLLLSAKTKSALEAMATNLANYLARTPDVPLADVAFTLQNGRAVFNHRLALSCQDSADAITALTSETTKPGISRHEAYRERPVAFLLPALGEHYIDAVRELYQQEEVFRTEVDRCCALLQDHLQQDLRALFQTSPAMMVTSGSYTAVQPAFNLHQMPGRAPQAASEESEEAQQLKRTTIAQPMVFVVEYALAKLLMQWGIQPQALLGYSLGEYVAACLAGVFSLEDALKLVAYRARLIQEQPEGAMLAVGLSEDAVQTYLQDDVDLAACNGPATCVLAGSLAAIENLEQQLSGREVAYRRVETTHAFHSHLLTKLREPLTAAARGISFNAPCVPYISNVTGTWITDEQATDPSYWAEHMCQPIRFSSGIETVLEEPDWLLLEVGPGQALSSFVKQHPACDSERASLVLSTLPPLYVLQPASAHLATMLGKLWLSGVAINWQGFSAHETRRRVSLPTYPFERQRYWVEADIKRKQFSSDTFDANDEPERLRNLSDWFYTTTWKQTPSLTSSRRLQVAPTPRRWLVFADECGLANQVTQLLQMYEQQVITVRAGQRFEKIDDLTYTLRASERDDYRILLKILQEQELLPTRIAHLWMVTAPPANESDTALDETLLQTGFYSLMSLTQELGSMAVEHCEMNIISNNLHDVLGEEIISPAKALLLGPCRVIPQEYAQFSCRSIDLPWHANLSTQQEVHLLEQLLAEVLTEPQDALVALRGRHRWIQDFAPIPLEKPTQAGIHIRPGGTYLITGGLGGIGLALAEHLVRTYQASVVLTARTALPPREQWTELLQTSENPTRVQAQIRKVLELEKLGGRVLIRAADVSNEAQMREVVQDTQATFGELHGVIHSAGLPGIGLMQFKTPADAAKVLASKVFGTLTLRRVLQGTSLDFLALFSSMTSITSGGPGQLDYCAANAFMDAYAQRYDDETYPIIAIDWGEWKWNAWEDGLAGYDTAAQTYFRAHRAKFGIAFHEGVEAFERILASWLPYVIVSTQNFRAIVARSKFFSAATLLKMAQQARKNQVKHPRPSLASVYIAPRNARETSIAAVWEELLGISPVGIEDNFFELGGNSLAGIDLINRLRKVLQNEQLAAHVLYEAPTISALAAYAEQTPTTLSVDEWQDRSSKRRAGLRQRGREMSHERESGA